MSSVPEPLRTKLAAICGRLLPADGLTPAQLDEFIAQIEHALQSAKLESLAEFAAGAGHEINNPVATIAGRAQLLLSGETDPERRHALEIIGGQALRIRDMIGDTMLFARPPQPRFEELNLLEFAQKVVVSQASLTRQQAATISISIPQTTTIWADRTQLLVLLSSLLQNSLEAAEAPGIQIQVTSQSQLKASDSWLVITVSDYGVGFSPLVREHLFDPFFSGRQAGRGLGFGLSKCWRIVQSHGGEIFVKQPADRGALFEIWWPPRPV